MCAIGTKRHFDAPRYPSAGPSGEQADGKTNDEGGLPSFDPKIGFKEVKQHRRRIGDAGR
jgi:hypothetical protein